jgi:hypothetical protein
MRSLQVDLARVPMRLRCDFAPLMDYATAHFGPALAASRGSAARPQVDAELHWHEGHPPTDPAKAYPEIHGCDRFDRDLWVGPGRLVWLRVDEVRDLHLRFAWDGESLTIRGDYYHRLSKDRRADRLRRLVYRRQMDSFRRKRFTRLLYYLVYYPLFWWLEHVRDTHPLHAAAVDTPAGGILLAGPSGVGKSTLTMGLGTSPEARILSDTFVAHRGTELWAVPEPMLLDRWSIEWLGDAGAALAGVEHPYALGRGGYSIPAARFTERSEAALILLPRRAAEHFVRRVDGEVALARIDAYDDIVNDLRRYRPLAAVLELLSPSGIGRARLRSLEELTAAVPCYEVGLTSSLTCREAVTSLLTIRDGSEQSSSSLRRGR